jgi:hypothetical protein
MVVELPRLERSCWITMAIAVTIILYQIILPPVVGLADNGDSAKIIGKFNLKAPDDSNDRFFRFIYVRYTAAPANHWNSGFRSSETLLLSAAMWANRLVSKDGSFDLRCMGIIHAALFLLAFALLLPLLRHAQVSPRSVLAALAVLMFCDVMYSAWYNSFYMDAGAFVFLLLSIVFLLRGVWGPQGHRSNAWCALLFCLLFVTAKAQHALLGIPLAMFLVWKRDSLWPRRARLYSTLSFAALSATGAFSLGWSTPSGYSTPSLFNVIFWGLLPSAEDPRAELASLGLDESFLRYKGLYTWSPDSPMRIESFVREFVRRTSFTRLGMFYTTHPHRALKMFSVGLKEATRQRPLNFGNFDKSAGYPPYFQSSAFSVWSTVKRKLFYIRPWAYLLVFGIAVAIVAWQFPAGGVVLAALGLFALAFASLADACEVTRHLFIFNAVWDIGFFAAICALVLGSWPQGSKHLIAFLIHPQVGPSRAAKCSASS